MSVPEVHGIARILLFAALFAVLVFDLRKRTIPNELVAMIALGGLVHAVVRGGVRPMLASLLGVVVGCTLLLWQFRRGLMGGGDVKLLGALGSWAGALGSVYILLLGSILGGVLALVSLVRLSRTERDDVSRNLGSLTRGVDLSVPAPPSMPRSRGIPYGVALAAAGVVILSLGVGR